MATICRSPMLCLIGFALISGVLFAQGLPATVEKIEPSGWQPGPASNLMLTLSGRHMDGVLRVTVRHRGVQVIGIESRDSNHLFVLLHIGANAEPGTMMLQLFTQFMTTFAAVPMFSELSPRSKPSADE